MNILPAAKSGLSALCGAIAFTLLGFACPTLTHADETAKINRRAKFWAAELGSENYHQRVRAAKRLSEMGVAAIPALTDRARQNDLEAASQSVKILSVMLAARELNQSSAAFAALESISRSRTSKVASQAWSAIISMQPKAVDRLEDLGAEFSYDQSKLRLGADYTGGDDGLIWLRYLWVTTTIRVQRGAMPEASLRQLQTMPSLSEVVFDDYPLTDQGLALVAGIKGLSVLHAARTKVSSTAVVSLCKRRQLEWLDLSDTPVDDAIVGELIHQTGLEGLELTGAALTDAGVDRLRQALPRTKVLW